jgi:hypothetical protein
LLVDLALQPVKQQAPALEFNTSGQGGESWRGKWVWSSGEGRRAKVAFRGFGFQGQETIKDIEDVDLSVGAVHRLWFAAFMNQAATRETESGTEWRLAVAWDLKALLAAKSRPADVVRGCPDMKVSCHVKVRVTPGIPKGIAPLQPLP